MRAGDVAETSTCHVIGCHSTQGFKLVVDDVVGNVRQAVPRGPRRMRSLPIGPNRCCSPRQRMHVPSSPALESKRVGRTIWAGYEVTWWNLTQVSNEGSSASR